MVYKYVRRRYRDGLLMLLFGLTAVVFAACSNSEDATATGATVRPTATTVPSTATAVSPTAVSPTATTLPTATMPAVATTPPTPTETPVAMEAEQGVTVDVRATGAFGEILIGPNRLTLYIFDRDIEGVSNCAGGCLNAWPPLLVDKEPALGDGVTATIGTITRGDGSTQVTVNGFPAYYWQGDTEEGDTGGQGVNNAWWVFNPDGTPQRPAKVAMATDDGLGGILVDGSGRTLYIYDRDTEGVSNCSGGCLGAWPPLLTEYPPVAVGDVTAAVGSITRSDGTVQVTVNGFPAYYWQSDVAAGDTLGHARGGVWWVFNPNGTPQRPAKVALAEHPTLGNILVDGAGLTLYLFDNDTPGVSNCSGGCLNNWLCQKNRVCWRTRVSITGRRC